MDTSVYSNDFVTIRGHSDAGRSGKNNEDYWGRFSILAPDPGGAGMQPAELIVVADGIGGSRGGEVASSMAVRTIGELLQAEKSATRSIEQRLDAAIAAANEQIYQRSANDPDLLGMGTTVLAVVVTSKQRCYVGHAGDCRAYLIRGNRIDLLTQDHTRVQEMVDMGRITVEEAKEHPNRHVVSRFVGINDVVSVDFDLVQNGTGADKSKVRHVDLQPGDTLLCCSDGLNDMLDDEDILALVRRHGVRNAPAALVDAANEQGGDDNITAVVVSLLGARGVAVTPPAGVTARRIPAGLVLGVLALLLIGGTILTLALSGRNPLAAFATGGGATPTIAAAAGSSTETPVGIAGGVAAATATADNGATPDTPAVTPTTANGVAPLATSTRLVPTATLTPSPSNTAAPTSTRPSASATARPPATRTPNSPATQPSAPPPAATATRPPNPTAPPPAPSHSPVVLLSPSGGESFAVGSNITFSWQSQAMGPGEMYHIRIWKQSVPGVMEAESITEASSFTFRDLNPETYQWAVQIFGPNGVVAGTSSPARTFSVTGGVDPTPTTPPQPSPVPTDPPLPTRDVPEPRPAGKRLSDGSF